MSVSVDSVLFKNREELAEFVLSADKKKGIATYIKIKYFNRSEFEQDAAQQVLHDVIVEMGPLLEEALKGNKKYIKLFSDKKSVIGFVYNGCKNRAISKLRKVSARKRTPRVNTPDVQSLGSSQNILKLSHEIDINGAIDSTTDIYNSNENSFEAKIVFDKAEKVLRRIQEEDDKNGDKHESLLYMFYRFSKDSNFLKFCTYRLKEEKRKKKLSNEDVEYFANVLKEFLPDVIPLLSFSPSTMSELESEYSSAITHENTQKFKKIENKKSIHTLVSTAYLVDIKKKVVVADVQYKTEFKNTNEIIKRKKHRYKFKEEVTAENVGEILKRAKLELAEMVSKSEEELKEIRRKDIIKYSKIYNYV